jgi:hypothetical protein
MIRALEKLRRLRGSFGQRTFSAASIGHPHRLRHIAPLHKHAREQRAQDFALPAFRIADVVERHFDAVAARDGQGHATFFDSLAQTKHGPRTKALPGLQFDGVWHHTQPGLCAFAGTGTGFTGRSSAANRLSFR